MCVCALMRWCSIQCAQRLASFLKGLGVATVLDLQTARSLALAATGSDFVTRFRASFPAVPSQLNSPACGSSLPATTAQPPPLAKPSATPPEFPWQVPGNTTDNIRERCNSRDQPDPDKGCCNGSAAANARLPMLISACPGELLITQTRPTPTFCIHRVPTFISGPNPKA